MRRRGFVKALAAIPAVPALLAQQATPTPPAPAVTPIQPPSDELPVLNPSVPDVAAEMMPRFFSPAQFSALRKVSDLLMPAINGAPGALDAKAPEFLDFLIGQSPADRQHVYQSGLDALNQQSSKQFQKPFAELDAAQAATLLAALRQPWTFEDPSDPIAAFLRVAKQDVRTATVNSREYSAATSGGGGRRFGGGGLYWYPLD
jgi:Gluconate 2-dehydrogenase subunit 3